MKKFLSKLKSKLNNRGSSIIMVVVSLAFIGIIIGALLSAAGYAYRLKLQEMNAKDNFYYVEQAMQEIYAGVGTHTVEEMKAAYTYTLENMVRFDTKLGTYVTISDEEANKMFKNRFMSNIKNSAYFATGADGLADSLSGYISNDTVVLDKDKLSLVKNADSIVIKDVTLTRTQEYDKSVANGTYTQTISADITICEPDFDVKFNNIGADYSAIFDFAMVADMGVEVNQGKSVNLSIIGNIYAASDYYNKSYDGTLNDNSANVPDGSQKAVGGLTNDGNNKISGKYNVLNPQPGEDSQVTLSYKFANITNKEVNTSIGLPNMSTDNGFINDYAKDEQGRNLAFNGLNENSKYSGFYINNSNVSIMADTIIVPGTLAVMNTGNLTVYGKTGASTIPQVWADDIVLGGSSTKNEAASTATQNKYDGATAMFRANLFVKDDTELNAEGSKLTLNGSYYGYGDSTSRDSRVFFDTVDRYYFMLPSYDADNNIVKDADGNIVYEYNRGHYNSSSIVVNGEDAALDFSQTKELYVAGRAYIELSKYNTEVEDTENDTITNVYQYIPSNNERTNFVQDYKTGESISYKANQLMYVVSNFGVVSVNKGTLDLHNYPDVEEALTDYPLPYILANFTNHVAIPEKLDGVGEDSIQLLGFGDFFPKSIFGGNLPVQTQTINGRNYVFIDFEGSYNVIKAVATLSVSSIDADAKQKAQEIITAYDTADAYQTAFAVFYATESVKGEDSIYYPELADISSYTDFNQGDIEIDIDTNAKGEFLGFNNYVYSSGAISVRMNNKFLMTTAGDATVINDLLSDSAFASYRTNVDDETSVENMVAASYNLSNDLEMEYNYVKWNLAHYETNDIEKQYVSDVVRVYGEDALTPINKYMLFDNLTAKKPIAGFKLDGYELNSGNGDGLAYRLWASEDDVTITGSENITGIVITKGDVTFGDDVRSFNGLIVSGGKIYINGSMNTITADPATCREILRQCMVTDNENTKYFLSLFKEYASEKDGGNVKEDEDATPGDATPDMSVGMDTISYTDVVSMDNWMKQVGGAYETN